MSRLLHPSFQLFLTILLITVAEIFLKQGADATATAQHDWLGTSTLTSRAVWIGAGLLAASSITWILVLKSLPLYLGFTWCSIIHVTIPLASWLVLGEKINAGRWLGIALVLAGVCLIARPASRIEERA